PSRPLHTSTTLFPYTTLFRSIPTGRNGESPGGKLSASPHVHETPDESGFGRQILCAVAISKVVFHVGKGWQILLHKVAQFRLLRSEEHTSELQSLRHLVCRLL